MIRSFGALARAQWEHTTGVLLAVAGLVLLMVGIRQVAEARSLVDQLSFLMSTGVFGLGLVAVGVGVFISGDLHDEWRRLDRLEAAVRAGQPAATDDLPRGGPAPAAQPQALTGRPAR